MLEEAFELELVYTLFAELGVKIISGTTDTLSVVKQKLVHLRRGKQHDVQLLLMLFSRLRNGIP